jgi:hypothetical protein
MIRGPNLLLFLPANNANLREYFFFIWEICVICVKNSSFWMLKVRQKKRTLDADRADHADQEISFSMRLSEMNTRLRARTKVSMARVPLTRHTRAALAGRAW